MFEVPVRPMIRTTRKWGDSLAITIPKAVAQMFGLEPGDDVAVVIVPLNNGNDNKE